MCRFSDPESIGSMHRSKKVGVLQPRLPQWGGVNIQSCEMETHLICSYTPYKPCFFDVRRGCTSDAESANEEINP